MIIQGITFSGKSINKARWEVPEKLMQIGNEFTAPFKTKDKDVLSYFKDKPLRGITVEKENTVFLTFKVVKVRDFLVEERNMVETLVEVEPLDRNVEEIVIYLLNPAKANPNFHRMIKNELASGHP